MPLERRVSRFAANPMGEAQRSPRAKRVRSERSERRVNREAVNLTPHRAQAKRREGGTVGRFAVRAERSEDALCYSP